MNEATWKKHRLLQGDNLCKNHPRRGSPSIKVVTETDAHDNYWSDDSGNVAANSFSLDAIPYDGATNGKEAAVVNHPTTSKKTTKATLPTKKTNATTTTKKAISTNARKDPPTNGMETVVPAKTRAYNTRNKYNSSLVSLSEVII